jgi:hypothetical protein
MPRRNLVQIDAARAELSQHALKSVDACVVRIHAVLGWFKRAAAAVLCL